MSFKETKELEEQYYNWLKKHPEIDNIPFSVITFLDSINRLKGKDEMWIPFEEKEADEDEREEYGCEYILCNKLPDEDEEILVTYFSGHVGEDTFLRDGYECYLDSGMEFITEAIAWMPKPKPYKGEA
jgi:hypothetical protein